MEENGKTLALAIRLGFQNELAFLIQFQNLFMNLLNESLSNSLVLK